MMTIDGASLLMLSAIVLIESTILLSVLRDTYRFNLIFRTPEVIVDSSGPTLGLRVPPFSVASLTPGKWVTEDDVLGSETIFLFFTSENIYELTLHYLAYLVELHWSNIDGTVFVVCCSPRDEAKELARSLNLARYGADVEVLVDHDLALKKRLNVAVTPSSVQIDENGRVARLGEISNDSGSNPKSNLPEAEFVT